MASFVRFQAHSPRRACGDARENSHRECIAGRPKMQRWLHNYRSIMKYHADATDLSASGAGPTVPGLRDRWAVAAALLGGSGCRRLLGGRYKMLDETIGEGDDPD